jgi:glycogen debranching enzyme
VELNALWYNALCILAEWIKDEQGAQAAKWVAELAQKTKRSFNEQFWYAEGRYLYDVIDETNGKDTACRPNQIFAISLDHPVLETAFWAPVLEKVSQELLTPYGLRSLSPKHPDYKIAYIGNLWARDAAYHQGTVWGWLIGPYIDAWLKVHPNDFDRARGFLKDFETHMHLAGMGTISEIFDGDFPYEPRGCIAQAWSVGEVLRCLLLTSKANSA